MSSHGHTVHLRPEYVHLIRNGQKTIEGRLNRSPYNQIKTGDLVKLYSGPEDDVTVRIESKRMYQTFEEMLTTEGLDKCLPGIKTVDHGIKIYRQFYSEKDEMECGVVALEVVCHHLAQASFDKMIQ